MIKFKFKTFIYTWRYFINNNFKNFNYFLFGYKSNSFLKKKTKIKSIDNKLDLVEWFVNIQEDVKLKQFSTLNEQTKFSTNFEFFLGKADLDITRMMGYIDVKLLNEITVRNKIHKLERDKLIRHLVFYKFLKHNNINPFAFDFKQYDEHLDLLINLKDVKKLNSSNKIYFLLDNKHLSNKKLLHSLKKSKNSPYFYHKQFKDYYHQLSEYITLFDYKENETTLPLSGTVDRVLQESAWRGRYRVTPTLVKGLDQPDEFIQRLGMNSYKANINYFDYKWWELHYKLSSHILKPISNNNVGLQDFTVIYNNLFLQKLNISCININEQQTWFENNFDYINLLQNSNSNLKLNTINKQLWFDFTYILLRLIKIKNNLITRLIYNIEVQKNNINLLVNVSKNFNKNFKSISIKQLNFYQTPEHYMLQYVYSKFKNLFFLRATIGANWGFLDIDLLQEEQEKREKDKYYQKYDDNRKFFYFLNPKDTPGFDDNTFITDVKYKRFVDDVYQPILVSPHKRPYNWLKIPEMSFSPFFLFLKNVQFMWYNLFGFNLKINDISLFSSDPQKSTVFNIFFHKQMVTRFVYGKDFTYTYWLKYMFSWDFLNKIFQKSQVFNYLYTFNMDFLLKNLNNTSFNLTLSGQNNYLEINNLITNLSKSFYMPSFFRNYYNINSLEDIYNYNNFFLSNNILETTLKIEQRKANQMRFNFMYKLGLSPEHSWFFLYNAPTFFKQTIAYQAWVKERVPNTYVWEHDNPFLIQQIFRPYSLDLTRDITLYKYKADMLQLLLFGFRDIAFADTFLVKNYYTKEHKSRSIFEIPQFTIPFFLFDSDLYSISRVPETILYEHISAFGIPALERQWDFHEVTLDLALKQQTSAWPNYLFNSEAYAMVLWTSRSTKNTFNLQEYDTVQKEKSNCKLNIINKNKKLNKKINNLSNLSQYDFYKIYSYFFKTLLSTKDFEVLKNNYINLQLMNNLQLTTNFKLIVNQLIILQSFQAQLQLFFNTNKFINLLFFYEQYYIHSIFFNSKIMLTHNIDMGKSVTTLQPLNEFYVVYIIYLYLIFFILN